MPNLIDRVRTFLDRFRSSHVAAVPASAPAQRPKTVDAARQRFAADRRRADVVKRCREMYTTDTRAQEIIQTLARDVAQGGFNVSCPQDPEAEAIAADLVRRLALGSRLDDFVRLSLRDGDTFLEVSVAERTPGAFQIATVTRKPALQMHRASNAFDAFDDPEHAYWWGDTPVWGETAPANALWFAAWQIVHARWNHDEGQRYGTPLFGAATAAWKRVVEGERDIAIRRKARAGIKTHHKFPPGTDPTDIQRYREENKTALDDPYAAAADYFGTNEIEILQGDAHLAEIDDVLHHIRTWWLASPVPMSLLGYGQDLNRDVLAKQKEQYDETIPVLQQWVSDQLVRPLLELEWMFYGYWPAHLDYEIQWRRKQTLTPEDLAKLTDAALRLRALQWPEAVVIELLQAFVPNVDLSVVLRAARQDGAATPDVGEAV